MDIAGSKKERHTVYLAVFTLLIVGVALMLSTWQMLRQQQEATMQHMALTAKSVLQAVDSSMRRGSSQMDRVRQDTREFFMTLEQNEDLLFVGILDPQGENLRARPPRISAEFSLPPEALAELQVAGRWQGPMTIGGTKAYVAAKRLLWPRFGRRPPDGPGPEPAPPPGGGPHGHGGGMQHGRDMQSLPPEKAPFLVVALDMEKHEAVYASFRNAAYFQAAYILAAMLLLWVLAVRFLSRRALAGKALFLERFQARLLDALPEGLLITDQEGVIRAANPAALAIFAPEQGGLVGTSLAALHLPLDTPSLAWRQHSLEGLALEVFHLPFQSEGGPSVMVIVRDRTRIRSLEKSLAEAEKLAALGTLAAGVAHEIRNPLSALRGFAQYFAKKLSGKEPEETYATTMVREADRLNRVITDLLYLARPRILHVAPVDLNSLADELEELLRFDLRDKGLVFNREFGVSLVRADRDTLKSALLNLLLNAVDALGAGADGSGPPRITLRSAPEGDGVLVAVADNGPGMCGEDIVQAFEPFFTTKGKGTGLGLALVHKTMREHGGEARIESSPGRGCEVRLLFPGESGETPSPPQGAA